MRIGIDARELCGRATGAGRYLGGLLTEWSTSDRARAHEFVLYAPQPIAMRLDARRFATRQVAGSGGTLWEQLSVPRVAARDHLDVWFAPAYSAPLTLRMPVVVAIHDVSFVAHPEWFTWREGAKRRLIVKKSAHRARTVVTISEFTRGELIERLAIAPHKISVIPPGIAHPAPHPAPNPAPGTSTQHPAPSTRHPDRCHPNVLFTGSIFNRRHVPDLIRAFAPIARAHPDAFLDIAGDNRSFPFEDLPAVVTAERLDGRVRFHRYVSDEQLAGLYANAAAFAFLSEYEGLGLTPLEALAAGVPPVLLDTPVARESCGDAALYAPPHDLRAVTQQLERLLFSETTRAAILAAASPVLAKYQWPRAARDTLAVLESSPA
jgi:glycosyltransferase involved in cell wall biosynthesis